MNRRFPILISTEIPARMLLVGLLIVLGGCGEADPDPEEPGRVAVGSVTLEVSRPLLRVIHIDNLMPVSGGGFSATNQILAPSGSFLNINDLTNTGGSPLSAENSFLSFDGIYSEVLNLTENFSFDVIFRTIFLLPSSTTSSEATCTFHPPYSALPCSLNGLELSASALTESGPLKATVSVGDVDESHSSESGEISVQLMQVEKVVDINSPLGGSFTSGIRTNPRSISAAGMSPASPNYSALTEARSQRFRISIRVRMTSWNGERS